MVYEGPMNANIVSIVKCRLCSSKYKHPHGGGYGNYERHIKNKHPEKLGLAQGQTQLTGYRPNSNQARLFTYDHASASNALSESMCVDHLSFRFYEATDFNDYMINHAQPAYKTVSRKTMKSKTMKRFALYKQ